MAKQTQVRGVATIKNAHTHVRTLENRPKRKMIN